MCKAKKCCSKDFQIYWWELSSSWYSNATYLVLIEPGALALDKGLLPVRCIQEIQNVLLRVIPNPGVDAALFILLVPTMIYLAVVKDRALYYRARRDNKFVPPPPCSYTSGNF